MVSAFALVSSRCDHFKYIEHLESRIAEDMMRLHQLDTPVNSFIVI